MTRKKRVSKLFREYYQTQVVNNAHLWNPLFYAVMGAYISAQGGRYMLAGKEKLPRAHLFIVQDSRSGKSLSMKASKKLLTALGVVSEHVTSVTDPWLIGTVNAKGNITYGALNDHQWISFDEGDDILRPKSFNDQLLNNLQTVMDSGMIVRGMAKGTIRYPSETTIVSGTYPTGDIQATLLNRGLLQRMLVTYKKFSNEEKEYIWEQQHMLAGVTPQEVTTIIQSIQSELEEIQIGTVSIPTETLREFMTDVFIPYARKIFDTFSDDKQASLNAFLSCHDLLYSLASIDAILDGSRLVTKDHLDGALSLFKEHIESATQLLEQAGTVESKTEKFYERTLKKVLKNNKSMKKSRLIGELVALDQWKIGENQTRKYINRKVSEGFLNEDTNNPNNAKFISIDKK